jgi:nucleoside-diphosphate-sugar epimerase
MTDSLARVAVTGSCGFIGAAVCARLAADGHGVAAIDVRGERPADVTDRAALTRALDGADAIVHTAAIVTDWGAMADFVRVNVGGTRNVLDAAGERPVVHVSSVAAWGYEFGRDIGEDAPTRRTGAPYVDTKAASDDLARRRGATVIRPGDVYGPGSVPWVIRPIETMRARLFTLPGDGTGVMTPIYVDDLVDAIVRAVRAPEAAAGVGLAVHDGRPIAARDFFAHHARMLGRTGVPTAPRPLVEAGAWAVEGLARLRGRTPVLSRQAIQYVSRRAAYPNDRARELLGWAPQVSLDEGMRRTQAWLQQTGRL